MKHVDAVEILPAMVAAAPLFAAENRRYERNPKVRVVVEDGRHFLSMSEGGYDIVSINATDPRLRGGSSLFHADFYEIVKRHPTDGGVVVQHAFAGDIAIVLRTLSVSFTSVKLFPGYGGGFNVVAGMGPLAVDRNAIVRLTAQPMVTRALRRIGFVAPVSPEVLAAAGFDRADYPEYFDPSVPVATDDRPRLELSIRGGPTSLFFSND